MRYSRKYLVREDGTFHMATDNLPMGGYHAFYRFGVGDLAIFLLDNHLD